ncbi:hydroxymethylglutaryl-CoA reductase, degradative [Chondromyces apiculatus]|uniref:3-hydroxy-3-methylglutaryl coenzyme A reductase n=1 Tax=Chondromyces apiculatus DSM 436 TaxID=1192034 RepID=A0A017T1A9_9BACT|nr:hydroxymethylglutaryl-CoA reductase, degradative [Chondromyces apiculatus]EYF02787.1 Hydroxymethylglutaryl-CoA reductase [Chondromyces apiculatus DSM 436]
MRVSTSQFPGFRTMTLEARLRCLAEALGREPGQLAEALASGGLDEGTANAMVENAIGVLGLPFGVALNFQVNGREVLVPMATEEPSVIAAASHAAKRTRAGGGFEASVDRSIMAAQIEVHDVTDPEGALGRLREAQGELLAAANQAVPGLVERGGGAQEVECRSLGDGFVVVHVLVDCCDAMGANLLNTIAETLGARVAELAGGSLGLRILSNYCDRRCVRVRAQVAFEALGCNRAPGDVAARGIASASRFAELDVYRAVTHNKGVMNGVDAVALATGNDTRAIEAAAHAYAARSGVYRPLATWRLAEGGLVGELTMPLSVGTVGGALRAHRGARLALDLVGARSAGELAMVMGAAGLATNLAALRALATEGIQRGHMSLHHRATSGKVGA